MADPTDTQRAGGQDPDRRPVLARLDDGDTVSIEDVSDVFAAVRDRFGTDALGLRWDSLHRDRIRAHLDADERHHQPSGIVHGGVWCAVVESLASVGGSLRVASSGRFVVGVSNTTDFLRPHRGGRVDAVATPVHVGRLQQLWLVELARARDGKLVARGQVRLQNMDADQLAPGS